MDNTQVPLKKVLAESNFLNIKQTAAIFGISERTLFRMINRGQIMVTKIRGSILIKSKEIERLVK